MSALSGGNISLKNVSESDDSRIMKNLLDSNDTIKNAGHAGTVMRFMTAYLSLQEGRYILTGTDRMKERPIGELVNALRELGADIEYVEKDGFPPLRITGRKLNGGSIKINSGISSQYISAMMMIGPFLKKGLEIILEGDTISSSYIDLTAGLMTRAGANVIRKGEIINIASGNFKMMEMEVEADWSSASYWFSIVGLSGIQEIILPKLSEQSLQGDSAIRKIFEKIGVGSEFIEEGLKVFPIPVKNNSLIFDFRNNPDMVQTIIPYCIAKNIVFSFSGCRSLRIKETDRVSALYRELNKFGVSIEFSDDGDQISWNGTSKPEWNREVTIETYHDHRMALGFAPLSLLTGQLVIRDPAVVSKSYPGFWVDLKKAGFRIEEVSR